MKNIKKISYSYNNNFKNPINYHIQTETVTTSLEYKDAIQIAFAVIDSLHGDYDYIEDLIEKYNKERDKEIKFEEV